MNFDIDILKSFFGDNRTIEYFNEITSTNDALLEKVKGHSAKIGDIIVAGRQSAGRGRRGKSFASPEGGLYFSFVANNADDAIVTVAAGVATVATLEALGFDPEIKWVNDILIDGKKVCGILAQAATGTSLCIVGIGINLNGASIPEYLKESATALDIYRKNIPKKEELVGKIITEFERLSESSNSGIVEKYKKYLKLLGKSISIAKTGEVCVAEDVSDTGELIVKRDSGEIIYLNSGEISIIKKI